MDVHIDVLAVRQLSISYRAVLAGTRSRVCGAPLEVGASKFALTKVDAARKRSGVVVDAVVGNLQVMRPPMHEDAAAALRAVGDSQAVDARWVARVVARERVGRIAAAGVAVRIGIAQQEDIRTSGVNPGEKRGAGREPCKQRGVKR